MLLVLELHLFISTIINYFSQNKTERKMVGVLLRPIRSDFGELLFCAFPLLVVETHRTITRQNR